LDNEQWFVLHQLDENGCVGVDSVFVELYFPIYLPNSFTPNNDGINDVFKAYGDQLHDFKLEVRNRWGEVVYLSEDPASHWDGSMQGGKHYCQTDTYIWTVWFGTLKGVRKLRGHVNLLR
ncbi:MAG: gliding motility-associated C-terminal domain-containing protein, partial [Flavobacteriales bacterium]|nr:gliding motility-associated C-terminal domain-containing protein [Flavobacteriales bacterium]